MLDNGTDGSSTAHASAEYTLADEISSLLGEDVGSPSESPEPATPPAGAPPASVDAASPETPQARSEGTADAEHAGAPPVGSTSAANATPDAAVPQEPDPFADAKPFTYAVNGQSRTFDGIQTIGEHGAIVQPDALQKLAQRLSERDNLYERAQSQYQERAALEAEYQALTRWVQGKDQSGQDRVLTGADALAEQRALIARSTAALQVFGQALNDRELFASLVEIQQDASGQFYVAPSPQGQRVLQTMIENAALKAEQGARQHFASLRAQTPQRPAFSTSSPSASSSPDSPLAPEVAKQSVENAIQSLGVSGLTDEDKATLAEALPRYIRPATPEEKAVHGYDRVMDASFGKLIQHTASLRTAAAQQVKAATDAQAANQRTLAQAVRGAPRPAPRPIAPTPQPTPEKTDSDRAWDLAMNLSTGKLGTSTSL